MKRTLRLILGDQLNIQHSWFSQTDDSVFYVIMEIRQETDYVNHHIQKVLAFFQAMRSFADELRGKGHQVIYLELDNEKNHQSLTSNLEELISSLSSRSIRYDSKPHPDQ